MLTLTNVRKTFNKGTINEKKALNGIDLHLDPGDFVTIIGGNGAGKSTTIKMLTGILMPTEGEIRIDGITPWQKKRQFHKSIGVVFGQRSQLWWDLPALDSFQLYARMYGGWRLSGVR